MKLGIHIGRTNTKVVLCENDKILKKLFFYMSGKDSINVLDRSMDFDLNDIESVVLTGVGSSYIEKNKRLYKLVKDKRIKMVSEIDSLAHGALNQTKLDHALIASCGTGTAFIHASYGSARHIGGSGIGGGTIIGLSNLLYGLDNIEEIKKYALLGDTNNIDSLIEDITLKKTKLLKPTVTASNFGKVATGVKYDKLDVSSGILNMVYQTIAMLSVYAARSVGENNVVLVGAMSESEYAKKVLIDVKALHEDINFFIPKDGIYACALGATLL
jgi:type II pantothenate kinase